MSSCLKVRVQFLFGRISAEIKECVRLFTSRSWGSLVQDLIFVAATALIFAIAILYVRGCERLKW